MRMLLPIHVAAGGLALDAWILALVVPEREQTRCQAISQCTGEREAGGERLRPGAVRQTIKAGRSELWKLESSARPAERRGLQRDRTTVQLGELADDRETEP